MKKLNKLFAILVAMAMVLSLTAISAFATWEEDLAGKFETDLSKAVITKKMDVPEGVTAPTATFYFNVTPTVWPGQNASPAVAAPTIDATKAKIEFTTGSDKTGDQIGVLPLSDLFKLSGTGANITSPGTYEFTVSEYDNTASENHPVSTFSKVGDNNDVEEMKYDTTTTYTLRMYIVEGTDGLEPKAITVQKGTDSADANKKVDPKDEIVEIPGTEGNPATYQHNGSEFLFTNYYTKKLVDDTNGAYYIQKTLDGSADSNAKYPFDITITLDQQTIDNAGTADIKLAGYIDNNSDAKTEVVVNKTARTATFTGIKLGKDQKFVFREFPAGATVKVEEKLSTSGIQNQDKYTQTLTNLTAEAAAGQTNPANTTAAGFDLVANSPVINAKNQNAVVQNKLDASQITPEGILISNLPYIALALVAIGGLVAYVVIRRRNADEA